MVTTVRRLPVAIATVLATLAVVLGPVGPAGAAPVEPLFTQNIDSYAEYDGADTCSPTAKPGALALLDLLTDAYPGTYGYIGRACTSDITSEHQEGRAVDWMVSAATERDKADDFLRWLFATDAYGNEHAMVRRLGIMYIIWDREIWRAYDPDRGWQPYSGPNPHTDHIHLSMSWDGAQLRTTWTTGPDAGGRLDQARFAATWRDDDRLDVFRRAQSGELQSRIWAGQWGSWTSLGGSLSSGPAAAWSSRKRLWVFAQGTDGDLQQRRWRPSSGWGAWKDTGVPITAAPGVAVNDGRLDLFVRSPSGTLQHRKWLPKSARSAPGDSAAAESAAAESSAAESSAGEGAERGGWSKWTDLGGVLSAPPAATWSTPNTLDVFVRGTTNELHHKALRNGTWDAAFENLGGDLTSGPAAESIARDEIHVFVRTVRGSVSERLHGDVWGEWVDRGGRHVSAPAATGRQRERIDLFGRDPGGGLSQNFFYVSTGSWSGWGLK